MYDLFQVVWSLNGVDLGVFKLIGKDLWRRELILSDLFEQFNADKEDKRKFYNHWFRLKDSIEIDKSLEILCLIHQRRNSFETFQEIIDTLVHVSHLNLEAIISKLHNYFNPYKSCKIEWCLIKIKEKLSNRNVGEEHLKRISKTLAQLDTQFIHKLFATIPNIQEIDIFMELIKFCSEKKNSCRLAMWQQKC